jgi:septal ring factor EnvC (AmiA/AmiB activator)
MFLERNTHQFNAPPHPPPYPNLHLQLAAEKEATLRLKGENGIMRKKFSALQKDIEDQREEIKGLLEKQQQLYEKIKGLEKDIQGHKKEINEREETIQDKEKRIYDLKKKNQELEKFKFVLDYKIKELKRQIEPRSRSRRWTRSSSSTTSPMPRSI